MANSKRRPWFGLQFRKEATIKLRLAGVRIPSNGCKNHELWLALKLLENGELISNISRRLAAGISKKEVQTTIKGKKRKDTYSPDIGFKKLGHDFYKSDEWREVRYKALVMHGAQCQCCGATRADGVKLHVDHIKPKSKFPELALDIKNLQILCEDCNLGKMARDQTDWRHILPNKLTYDEMTND